MVHAVVCWIFVFFFKQKTAYEMRISDWSSDVCSSDLLAHSPRFSAYVASKAALDAFSRCAQAEFSGRNIAFTTINMPLVRTPMIAPTKMYESVPTISAEEAADLIVEAIIERPSRIATRLGIFAGVLNAVMPKAYEVVMNRSEEHTSELQSLMRISYAVFCLTKKNT